MAATLVSCEGTFSVEIEQLNHPVYIRWQGPLDAGMRSSFIRKKHLFCTRVARDAVSFFNRLKSNAFDLERLLDDRVDEKSSKSSQITSWRHQR